VGACVIVFCKFRRYVNVNAPAIRNLGLGQSHGGHMQARRRSRTTSLSRVDARSGPRNRLCLTFRIHTYASLLSPSVALNSKLLASSLFSRRHCFPILASRIFVHLRCLPSPPLSSLHCRWSNTWPMDACSHVQWMFGSGSSQNVCTYMHEKMALGL
jgi:hypothetical protein